MAIVTPYTVPTNPADPEAAALELIVHMPSLCVIDDVDVRAGLTRALQDYCAVLDAEGCFAGLVWADAKAVAAAVAYDVVTRDDATDFLRNRARNVLAGTDNMPWVDREAAAQALNIAAAALGL